MEEIVEIINRAQAGDSEAYGVLVSRFQDMAYGYAYAILGDFELAQDATQEAFIDAYQSLPNLREPLAFAAWLKQIVHKRCDRFTRRKRHSTVPLEAVAETASPMPGPAEVAERKDLSRRVRDAIRELPVQQRVVTTLFYINGYSYGEIADFIETPVATVKSRLHASRGRLKERIMDMVEDELKANALPEDFTQETVEQAVARAGELNQERQFDEAEQLLRRVLEKAPQHAQALKELNHALMQGRVYGQGRWEILPELVKYGKVILQTVDDEQIRSEFAKTLLAVPAMPEAVDFLTDWITQNGPNLERLGMLAWAKGCVADYDAAESLWQDFLALSKHAEHDEIMFHVPFVAYTLVDCFAEAGDLPRAKRIAGQAWERCRELGRTTLEVAQRLGHHGFPADFGWMLTFFHAQLELQEVANVLLPLYQTGADPRDEAITLCIRIWVDDPLTVAADWLDWARRRISAGDPSMPRAFTIRSGLLARGEWKIANQVAQTVWELLGQAKTEEAEEQRGRWDWQRFDHWGAIIAKDLDAAEDILRREIRELGFGEAAVWGLTVIAAIRGVSTPPDVVQYVEQRDVSNYYLPDWYVVAREAAAAGDEQKAFNALRKSLSYWTNSPYNYTRFWENDTYWGALRNHPASKEAFDERRRRVGPVYGQLHYFPGW